jgi:hypothetical protein
MSSFTRPYPNKTPISLPKQQPSREPETKHFCCRPTRTQPPSLPCAPTYSAKKALHPNDIAQPRRAGATIGSAAVCICYKTTCFVERGVVSRSGCSRWNVVQLLVWRAQGVQQWLRGLEARRYKDAVIAVA